MPSRSERKKERQWWMDGGRDEIGQKVCPKRPFAGMMVVASVGG